MTVVFASLGLGAAVGCADDTTSDDVGTTGETGDGDGDMSGDGDGDPATGDGDGDMSGDGDGDMTGDGDGDMSGDGDGDMSGDGDGDMTGDGDGDMSGDGDGDMGDDADMDGILDDVDNCVDTPNFEQEDGDVDGVGDACDNCANAFNPGQGDIDEDMVGDWCDEEVITEGILYVPEWAQIELSGDLCYEEIRIFGSIVIPPWDGMEGGSLWLSSASTIHMSATGFIYGVGSGAPGGGPSQQVTVGGFGGEGMGPGCGGGPGSSVGQGGTGASYGGVGGTPNNQWAEGNPCNMCSEGTIAHCEGATAMPYGTADGPEVELGSGGGAGGNSSGCSNSGGDGGGGGAAVVLAANGVLTLDGVINVSGEEPEPDDSMCGYRPGGGGGSGGTILIAGEMIEGDPDDAAWIAEGGNGGEALGDQANTWGWGGGGGGGGRIKVFGIDNYQGNVRVDGGEGGVAPNGNQSFPGDPGQPGTVGGSEMIPDAFLDLSCE